MKNMATNYVGPSPGNTSGSDLDQQMASDVKLYTDACEEYETVNAQYKQDMEEFNAIAAQDPMSAMIFFIEVCAPTFLSAQEANINVYSTQMNISNDMRAFGTDATNLENEATGMDADAGQAFENDINDLQKWTNYLDGTTEGTGGSFDPNAADPWDGSKTYLAPVDATNGASIDSDCTAIEEAFKTSTGTNWSTAANPTNGATISNEISSWFTVPTGATEIESYMEDPNIKATQEALQEINSSVSTLSSSQQTTFQYYLGNYNQCVSMCNSLGEEEIKGETTMISNQRAQ